MVAGCHAVRDNAAELAACSASIMTPAHNSAIPIHAVAINGSAKTLTAIKAVNIGAAPRINGYARLSSDD